MARTSGGIIVPNAYANPIINGGFEIWQRGASFTSIASGAYSADRWQYGKSGTVVHDILKTGDVPTIAALVPAANNCLHLDVTTADTSIASGDYCEILQPIEGYNFLPFWQKQLTVGFWVKSTITGIHCVSLRNGGSDRSCVMEYTVNASDTWEYKTVTFPASPSAGTWAFTNTVGAYLGFTLSAGSTFQTSAGSWATGAFIGTSNQVNSTSSTANNFKLWGVTMGLGPTVAPYWPRLYADELRLCQRYCYATHGIADGFRGNFYASSSPSTQFNFDVDFPVTMRATCTAPAAAADAGVTSIGAAAPTANQMSVEQQGASGGYASGATLSTLTGWAPGTKRCTMRLVASPGWTGMTAGLTGYLYAGSSVNMIFTAEL